ncbi:MAG: AraC family transcriptional regulator, partial [Herminiimonas sp.]|nr:AraC family transcriptional regulator [Herminiimonas sp.]
MSKLTTSVAWVKGMGELFEEEGLDVNALFSEAGLDETVRDDPDGRYPTEKVSLLWELAVMRTGDQMLGIAKARKAKPSNFDVVGYAMMSCPNLLASLECLVRYLRVVSEAATLLVHKEEGGYLAELQLFGGGQPVPRQRMEFDLLTLLSFLRWISGREFSPLWGEFTYATPADPQIFNDAFKCPVRFNASANRLMFHHADLVAPLPTRNPSLAKLHAQFAGQYLTRLDDKKTGHVVQELITRMLPSGEPRREDIASA